MINPDLKREVRRKMEALLRQHKRPKHGWSNRKKGERWQAFYDIAFTVLLASEDHGQAMQAMLDLEDELRKMVDDFIEEMDLDE